MNDISEKQSESLLVKNDFFADDIQLGLSIVKKYVINNNLIIVGGMAIDFALRLKGSKLYDDDILPDYDFYSNNHHYDAYKIAELLLGAGLYNINVINANHTSTMRVRVNFTVVADVTYIPKNIYDILPILLYKNIRFIHPYYQMIDQHRSLSLPYENSPWEVISHRWKKDATRYDMLYSLYPLKSKMLKNYKISSSSSSSSTNILEKQKKTNEHLSIKISSLIFKNTCIGGLSGLLFWKHMAEQQGFSSKIDFFSDKKKIDKVFGTIEIDNTGFIFNLPNNLKGVTIYTDSINKIKQKIHDSNNIDKETMYNRFLDKLPFSITLDNKFELFDNYGSLLSAFRQHNDIYIANLQNILLYLLCQLLILKNIQQISKLDIYYYGYLLGVEIIEWASLKMNQKYKKSKSYDNLYNKFLPTSDVYGTVEISDSYINSKRIFLEKLKENKKVVVQPKNVYNDSFVNKKIPNNFYKFDQKKSFIFNFNGSQTNKYYNRVYL